MPFPSLLGTDRLEIARWIRPSPDPVKSSSGAQRQPSMCFEIGFVGIAISPRHNSGHPVLFPASSPRDVMIDEGVPSIL